MRSSQFPPGDNLTTAQQFVGATTDLTTRQGDTYTAELIRGCHAGRLVLRHAGLWVQIDAADIISSRVHDDIPFAETRAVQVADRGYSRSYEGVTERAVTLVWTCPVCGDPRGEPRNSRLPEDGWNYWVHQWDNPCGHIDMYSQVLIEAGMHPAQPAKA